MEETIETATRTAERSRISMLQITEALANLVGNEFLTRIEIDWRRDYKC